MVKVFEAIAVKELLVTTIYGPSPTTCVSIGDAYSTAHSLNTEDDLFVSGRFEVKGISLFDGQVNMYSTTQGDEQAKFIVSAIKIGTIGGYVDDGLHICPKETDAQGNNNIIITANSNAGKNHDHNPASTNPTLFVHSDTDPDSASDEWISFHHDVTDAVITWGSGDLDFASATHTGTGDVNINGYVTFQVAGTAKKFATVA